MVRGDAVNPRRYPADGKNKLSETAEVGRVPSVGLVAPPGLQDGAREREAVAEVPALLALPAGATFHRHRNVADPNAFLRSVDQQLGRVELVLAQQYARELGGAQRAEAVRAVRDAHRREEANQRVE